MCFRRQRTQRHTRRNEPLADLVDRLDLTQWNLRPRRLEVEEIAKLQWIAGVNSVHIFPVNRIVAPVAGGLERVNQITVQRVRLIRRAQAVEPAHRKRDHILIKSLLMADECILLQARKAKTGDTA